MINNEFWQAASSSWSWAAKPDIKVKNGSGGEISQELLKNPYDIYDGSDYMDFDVTTQSMMAGGNEALKEPAQKSETEQIIEPAKPKISINYDRFDENLAKETIDGYTVCCKILAECGLSEDIANRFHVIIERLFVLKESDNKFQEVYEANLSIFLEN